MADLTVQQRGGFIRAVGRVRPVAELFVLATNSLVLFQGICRDALQARGVCFIYMRVPEADRRPVVPRAESAFQWGPQPAATVAQSTIVLSVYHCRSAGA